MNTPEKNILVPVDFKSSCEKAMHFAFYLAKLINGKIHLLYVIPADDFISDLFVSKDQIVKITSYVTEQLTNKARILEKEHATETVEVHVLRGKAYSKILECANEIKARYIILGENHEQDKDVKQIGTTVSMVAMKSPDPVVVVKGPVIEKIKRIIVPVDLTKESRKQIFASLVFGMHYNACVYFVSVVKGSIALRQSRIYRKLKKAQHIFTENGVESHIKLYKRGYSEPYQQIIESIKELAGDMVLLLTHAESSMHDNYIGAFAQKIINRSPVSVLSLTAGALESDMNQLIKQFVDPAGMISKSAVGSKRILKFFSGKRS